MSGGRRDEARAGARTQAVRVKTAKGRKISSTLWLRRQLNDPYVIEAQRQGYRSRAAFKLIQLDDKLRFLKPGMKVADLGAAPGGWTQVAVKRVHAETPGRGRVVGIDLIPWEPVPGAVCLERDFMDPLAPGLLKDALDGTADAVLSDMAANTTGHAGADHLRIMALVEAAYQFAQEVLTPGGVFVAKVFQGGAEHGLLAAMKLRFQSVRHIKPAASRKESSELYLVATGFR